MDIREKIKNTLLNMDIVDPRVRFSRRIPLSSRGGRWFPRRLRSGCPMETANMPRLEEVGGGSVRRSRAGMGRVRLHESRPSEWTHSDASLKNPVA